MVKVYSDVLWKRLTRWDTDLTTSDWCVSTTQKCCFHSVNHFSATVVALRLQP